MQYFTIVSYVAIGAGTYVYRPDLIQKLLPVAPVAVTEPVAAEKTTSKKQKLKKATSDRNAGSANSNMTEKSSEDSRTSKKRKIVGPVGNTVTAVAVDGTKKELPRDTEHDLDDKDFARQLAQAQAGTNLQAKPQQKNAAPTRSAASLQAAPAHDRVSNVEGPPSTSQDKNDGWASVESSRPKASSGKDVSDMLEPVAAGPATLRLTNVSSEAKKPKPQTKKEEPALTKKQRQREARKEETKRLQAEANAMGDKLKREQMQRARMAEGTSNQTKANNFAATAARNIWQNRTSTGTNEPTQATGAQLLDTFEPTTETRASVQTQPMENIVNGSTSSANVNAIKSEVGEQTTNALAASGRENGAFTEQSSLSEEEQLQRIREQEQEDAWEAVSTKKSKKKGRKEVEASSDTSPPSSRAASIAPTKQLNATKSNGAVKPKESVNRFATMEVVDVGGLREDEWQA
ncbi:hypothetical protein LTR64_008276 [Lithohypha guttulata]|uniref:uncharacterized protein n=1 Tax=Lithohypha guttulata TaxID=1690604 RepID=UPI002DDFD04C|nr:hypothetical protein LTR51_008428 [Lithohypha guttulata]